MERGRGEGGWRIEESVGVLIFKVRGVKGRHGRGRGQQERCCAAGGGHSMKVGTVHGW